MSCNPSDRRSLLSSLVSGHARLITIIKRQRPASAPAHAHGLAGLKYALENVQFTTARDIEDGAVPAVIHTVCVRENRSVIGSRRSSGLVLDLAMFDQGVVDGPQGIRRVPVVRTLDQQTVMR